MDYRRFRNLNESSATKETSKGMSFTEAVKQIGVYNKPVDFEGKKTKLRESKSNKGAKELPRAKTKHLDDLYSVTLDDMPFGGFTGTKEECEKKVAELKKGTDPRLAARLGVQKGADVIVREGLRKKNLKETAGSPMTTIRCAIAWYEDDDGYIQNVGVFADKLSLEEVAEILSEQGMMYVDVYDEYEASVPAAEAARLHPGDIVDIFDVDDEVINDFAESNGLDPEDYKHVGFFEGVKKLKESTNELTEIVGFIDCSGSNIGLITTLNNIAKKLGVSEYYYFTDHIATDIRDLKGYSTNYTDIYEYAKANPNKNIVVITDEDVNYCPGGKELTQLANVTIERIENHLRLTPTKGNLQEAVTSWEAEVAQADSFLDAIIKVTGNEDYDDGDGYWSGDDEWCNRYMYYANSVANLAQVEALCKKFSTDNCNFYVFEDDTEEDPVSEIGYTLTKASEQQESEELKEGYLADVLELRAILGEEQFRAISDALKAANKLLDTNPKYLKGGKRRYFSHKNMPVDLQAEWIEELIREAGKQCNCALANVVAVFEVMLAKTCEPEAFEMAKANLLSYR